MLVYIITFQSYIKGKLPKPEYLLRIFEVYNISIDWLLTGEGEMIPGDKKGSLYNKVEDEDLEIVELLSRTKEILKSGTDYSASLSANIRSFHHAVKMEKEVSGLKSRMSALETHFKKSEEIRKEDPPEKKEAFIKRRAMWYTCFLAENPFIFFNN